MSRNIIASVRGRLYNLAKSEHINFDQILLLYFQERLLYRLSKTIFKDKLILKGGLIILSKSNFKTRTTKDIDFLGKNVSNNLKEIRNIFENICEIEVDDGVELIKDSIVLENITERAQYDGVRIKLIATLGQVKKKIQIDIGFGDVVIPGCLEMKYPTLLNLDRPVIKAYSEESIIAEKFESMIKLSIINSRMKDFYDINYLLEQKKYKMKILQKAIRETFKRRNTSINENPIIFEEKFYKNDNKIQQWNNFLNKIGTENITFETIIKNIYKLLGSVYENILNNKSSNKVWNPNKKKWE